MQRLRGGKNTSSQTANANHTWTTYKWGGAELVASGYGQLKLVLIPDAAIDEEGLGGVQGTDAAVWATISSPHNGEEAREGQHRNREGEEEAQGGEVGVRLGNVSQAHDTMAGKHAIRTRGGLAWCDVCGA